MTEKKKAEQALLRRLQQPGHKAERRAFHAVCERRICHYHQGRSKGGLSYTQRRRIMGTNISGPMAKYALWVHEDIKDALRKAGFAGTEAEIDSIYRKVASQLNGRTDEDWEIIHQAIAAAAQSGLLEKEDED